MSTVSISLDNQTLHLASPVWRPKTFANGIVTDIGNTTGSGITKVPPGEAFEVSAEEAAALLRVHAGAIHSPNPPQSVRDAKAAFDAAHKPRIFC